MSLFYSTHRQRKGFGQFSGGWPFVKAILQGGAVGLQSAA
jgi:hypothetical protein